MIQLLALRSSPWQHLRSQTPQDGQNSGLHCFCCFLMHFSDLFSILQIVLLDHGLYKTISNDFRIKFAKFYKVPYVAHHWNHVAILTVIRRRAC